MNEVFFINLLIIFTVIICIVSLDWFLNKREEAQIKKGLWIIKTSKHNRKIGVLGVVLFFSAALIVFVDYYFYGKNTFGCEDNVVPFGIAALLLFSALGFYLIFEGLIKTFLRRRNFKNGK